MRTLPATCCLLLTALALDAGTARAQFQLSPPREGIDYRVRFRQDGQPPTVGELLLDELLQWELKLTDEQTDRLEAVEAKVRQRHKEEAERLARSYNENAEAERALYRREQREEREVLRNILSFAQVGRLEQIETQLRGPAAFDDPAVQEQLQLSAAQKEAVAKVLREGQQAYRDEFSRAVRASGAGPVGGVVPPGREMEEQARRLLPVARQTVRKLEALLNDAQKERWARVRGQPCEALPARDRVDFVRFFFNSPHDARPKPALDARQVATDLRDDLKLAPEQATRIGNLPGVIEAGHAEEGKQLRKKREELERARVAVETRQADEMAKAMTDVLTPQQRRRLEQVRLQSLGLAVWDDAAVRKALKLTDEQKAAINKARAEAKANAGETMRKAFEEAYRESGATSPRMDRLRERKAATAYQAVQARAVAVLTPEQQKRWRELIGPPFRLRVEFPFRSR